MICPECGYKSTRTIDTRETTEHQIRRRRECPKCAKRFTTYEKPVYPFRNNFDDNARNKS